jgi:hypothetical protein
MRAKQRYRRQHAVKNRRNSGSGAPDGRSQRYLDELQSKTVEKTGDFLTANSSCIRIPGIGIREVVPDKIPARAQDSMDFSRDPTPDVVF